MVWTQKKGRTVFAVAGVLVTVVVAAGIVFAVTGEDSEEAGPETTLGGSVVAGPTGTASGVSEPQYFGELNPEPVEGNRFRFESPDNIVWYPLLDGVPKEFTATRSKGFTRNEEGAALAAWHIVNRANAFNPDGYAVTFDEQVVGSGKPAMQGFAESVVDQVEPEKNVLNSAPVGYDVVFFNPLNAEIKVYAVTTDNPPETRNENKVAIPIELVWEDDDWKLVAPEDGLDFGSEITALDPQFSFGGNWK